MGNTEEFDKIAERCAKKIMDAKRVLLVSHIDADGLTSAGIMCQAMDRAGIPYDTMFTKRLDPTIVEQIDSQRGGRQVVFTDLGSGVLFKIVELEMGAIVADHHQPEHIDYDYHLNPHLCGYNGATDISGSGSAFFIARHMGDNDDLAALAIVGAVGDLQDTKENKLLGMNQEILQIGIKAGVIECKKDLKLYGKQTRPIYKLLQFNSDPYIPGLTANEAGCVDFIHGLGIPLKTTTWRRYIDLKPEERTMLVSGLIQECIDQHIPQYKVERLVGDTYTLLKEKEGSEMRDASEFSTLLNATARYDYAQIGLDICTGDRGASYTQACELLEQHRANIVRGLEFVTNKGVIKLDNSQYFHAGTEIKDTIVGIVAGMSYSIIGVVDRKRAIFAFSYTEGGVKVSARGNRDLTMRGLNLAQAIKEIAPLVGGTGGGHDIAAGANLPLGKEDEFMKLIDKKIGEQLRTQRPKQQMTFTYNKKE